MGWAGRREGSLGSGTGDGAVAMLQEVVPVVEEG